MAGAPASSPVPRHSGHQVAGPTGSGRNPRPPHTVQVKVLMAPVPPQWAQGREGARTRTTPRPPQTQQAESQDMMPKGSLPRPPQKEQTTSLNSTTTPSQAGRLPRLGGFTFLSGGGLLLFPGPTFCLSLLAFRLGRSFPGPALGLGLGL
jgi:hypothetical protein